MAANAESEAKRSRLSSGAAEADGAATSKAQDKEQFLGVFRQLVDELVAEAQGEFEAPADAVAWIKRMMEYTVPGGKLNRGLTVLHTARLVAKTRGETLSAQSTFEASVLGWCIEWLQAFFLVSDDIMDSSVTRRGNPCWYRVPGIGNAAINDAIILNTQIYRILRRHFRSKSYYGRILELFHETTAQTAMGQLLDLTTQPIDGPVDLNLFTLSRQQRIVKYKTAFYSFYLPIACGLVVSGIDDDRAFEGVSLPICLEMGEYFQVQDDYLDCYGAPEVIGKIGTDIQDNKCSWLVVQALKRANDEQRQIIHNNYGIDEESKIETIKQLFRDMELEALFKAYEEESYQKIRGLIAAVDATIVPPQIFEALLAKIYKRSV